MDVMEMEPVDATIEAADAAALAETLRPRLGPGLRDGDVLMFRFTQEDLAPIAALQTELGSRVKAMRVRRPNLNDVFLWVNAVQVQA